MSPASFPSDSIDAFIASRLPVWLTQAPADRLRVFFRALRKQEEATRRLSELLRNIPPLEMYARQLLTVELQQAGVSNQQAWRWTVHQEEFEYQPSVLPALRRAVPVSASARNLLTAALHNYHISETQANGLRNAYFLDSNGRKLPLSFEKFAKLCRQLDVGGRYQTMLDTCLKPSDPHGAAPGQAEREVHKLFEDNHRAHFQVAVYMALFKGALDERSYLQLLPVLAETQVVPALPQVTTARQLYLLGKCIRGVVTFEVAAADADGIEGVIAWIPGDPITPVARFATWQALYAALAVRLQNPDYRAFFARFVSERDRGRFFTLLTERLAKSVGSAIELDGRHLAVTEPLYVHLRSLQIGKIYDDARLLAVPTGDEDQQTRNDRFNAYASLGLDLLNLAGLFVPVLGEALLAVAAVQVASEVYEGYEDWRIGDREGALDHLFGVAENIAAGLLLAKGGAAAIQGLRRVAFVDGLVPLSDGLGKVRLCSPSLEGYEVDAGEVKLADAGGASHNRVLRSEDSAFQVWDDPQEGIPRIRRPDRAEALAPWVEDNGGGWHHALEQPQRWQRAGRVMRRLAASLADVPDDTAHQLLQITGLKLDQLRRLRVENAPAPSRLLDAFELHQLHEQMPLLRGAELDRVFTERQLKPSAEAAAVLVHDFPALSAHALDELLAQASGLQLDNLAQNRRVPLALAERARWLLHDTRIDRACAGVRLLRAASADSEALALGLVSEAAPWPVSVRVELREAQLNGRLLKAIGAEQAPDVRFIIRGEQGYHLADTAGQNLEFSQALLRVLEDDQKGLLGGFEGEDGLRDSLATLAAADRERAARLIGLAPVGQGVRPLHRFADGRIGYPLSGRAESSRQAIRSGIHQVFPTLTDEQMDAYLAELMQHSTGLWEHFSQLQQQLSRLREALHGWCAEAPGVLEYARRRRVARQVRRSWRRKITNHAGEYVLTIDGERLGLLPALPAGLDFGHVSRLVLRNMNLSEVGADFLSRFGNLIELDLGGNRLEQVPVGLERLSRLLHLNLSGNLIVMNVASERRLASLGRLAMLDLSHNPLGRAPVLTGLRQLTDVRLRDAGLETMPADVILRGHVDLRENRIRQLRQELNGLGERLQSFSLHDNPLDAQGEAALDRAAGVDRTGSRGGGSFRHRAVDHAVRDAWVGKDGALKAPRAALWESLHQEPDAQGLFLFLADFIDSDDFHEHPGYFRKRIWRILQACEQHEQLRLRVFAEASAPRTCEDQMLLILEQLELSLLAERVSSRVPPAELEGGLVRLGRQLARLDAVDRFAAAHIRQLRRGDASIVDDIETRLFFRLRLRQPLDLPIVPDTMHYEDFANVTEQDLRSVQNSVLEMENREDLIVSLAQRPFWEVHVRQRYPDRFDTLRQRFDLRLEQIEADLTAQRIDEWTHVQRGRTVMSDYQVAERDLISTLAREVYDRLNL
ncbi:NEL-type E3 ubiquitin ligase domain-containing protein [Pseudomonas putida]|uniref:NEL-type E3 ubiquitin ligase domain-containing protein n=1 Tax=Pseudomonas putida TaxID=303 RepID=UPI003F3E52C5